MAVELLPIPVPFNDDSVKVVSVRWSGSQATIIELVSKRSGEKVQVEFKSNSGLRILDELDLAGMWIGTERSALAVTWLFEVRVGGWFELESIRQDFYMKHGVPKREFLVEGCQDCVSIISDHEPIVRPCPR